MTSSFILGDPEVEATPELRMDCAFVDFREGRLRFGELFAASHLDRLLSDLESQAALILERL